MGAGDQGSAHQGELMFAALPAVMIFVFGPNPFRLTGWTCGRAARDEAFMSGEVQIK
jgi:hypothetical protein